MANSGSTISPAVTIPKDIFDVLGVYGNDLGTVCVSPAVNMWSKYKPTRYAKIGIMSDADFAAAQYSLNIPVFYSLHELGQAILAGTSVWGYNKPQGGSASPYRLTDFNGYEHSTYDWRLNNKWDTILGGSIVLGTGSEDNQTLKKGDRVAFYLSTREDGGDYGNLLSIEDFNNIQLAAYGYIKDWYGGIAFKSEADTTDYGYGYIIDTTPISDHGVNIYNLIGGQYSPMDYGVHYKVFPFLTSGGNTVKGSWQQGSFGSAALISLNNANFRVYRRFTTATDEFYENLTFRITAFSKSGTTTSVTIQAVNSGTTTYHISGSELYLVLQSEESQDDYGMLWVDGWIDNSTTAYGNVTYADQIRYNECYINSSIPSVYWGRSIHLTGISSIPVGTTNLGTFTVYGTGDSYGQFDENMSPSICIQAYQGTSSYRNVMTPELL